MDSSSRELELTPDLLEYAKAVALKEAPYHCGRRVDYNDVVQEAILQLLSRPPKFDPSRGAKPKTLVYTIVKRAVIKYAERERRQTARLRRFDDDELSDVPPGPTEGQMKTHQRLTGKEPTEHEELTATIDEMLRFIDCEESRALCRLVLECKGNFSAVARRLKVSEGTVRHRLRVLGPKLMAAGFDPFSQGGAT